MRRKGSHIDNPFAPFRIPRQIPPEKLELLVQELRNGTATARQVQRIYFGHMRLGIAIACRIGASVPSHISDLVNEAMLALHEGMMQAPASLVDNNITPFLSTIMKRSVINYLRKQNIRQMKPLDVPDHHHNDPYVDLLSKAHERIGVYQHHLDEIMEQIDYVVKEDQNLKRREYKRAIIRLKSSGYTTEEVADILDMSIRTVEGMVKEVRDRYFQIEGKR